MDALRRIVAQEGKAPKQKKRAEGQREMLLAIAGKGEKKPATRAASKSARLDSGRVNPPATN
jgi:hypothetical protein